MPVQLGERGRHLGHGVGALHRHLADLELHCGPTASGVLDDIALGRRVTPGDQPDPTRHERQPPLAVSVEETFGG